MRDQDARAPRPALVLVGPAGAGKTTLGLAVAALRGLAFVDLDEVGEAYYAEVGWSVARLVETARRVGRVEAERRWEPARAHAVSRVLRDHPGQVVALGAGHTSYTEPAHRRTVAAALRDTSVAYLEPFADRDRSLAELRRRCLADKGTTWEREGHDFLAAWLDDPWTRGLATMLVRTGEGDREQQVSELVSAVHSPSRPRSA